MGSGVLSYKILQFTKKSLIKYYDNTKRYGIITYKSLKEVENVSICQGGK